MHAHARDNYSKPHDVFRRPVRRLSHAPSFRSAAGATLGSDPQGLEATWSMGLEATWSMGLEATWSMGVEATWSIGLEAT